MNDKPRATVHLLEQLGELERAIESVEQLAHKLRARLVEIERDSGLYATEGDLRGPKGDPPVRFEPRGYRGPEMKGKRMSECTPEGLRALAAALAHMADNPQPGKEKYAAANRADAARARSWARKLRAQPPGEPGPAAAANEPGGLPAFAPPAAAAFAPPAFAPPAFEAPAESAPAPPLADDGDWMPE